MIGSIHGCVSCPVVVKPWEPESPISRPQNPLPSHPLHHSHPYSLPQRSSSVHPLPQKPRLGDQVCSASSSLSHKRIAVVAARQSTASHADSGKEKQQLSPEHGIVGKTSSASCSPSWATSSNGSPAKSAVVFSSQRDIALHYEKLLRPGNADLKEVGTSSHDKVNKSQQNENCDGSKNLDLKTDTCLSESQTEEREPASPVPKAEAIVRQHDRISSDKNDDGNSKERHDKGTGDSTKGISKSTSPPPADILLSSSLKSPPQIHKINFPPAPLPAIQDKTKMRRQSSHSSEADQQSPQIRSLSSVRPGKGSLPSLSNPKFQTVGSQVTTMPRPSLSLMKDRRRQTKRHTGKGNTPTDERMSDTAQKGTVRERRSSTLKEKHLASSMLTQMLPTMMSGGVDILPQSHTFVEIKSAHQDKVNLDIQTTNGDKPLQTHPSMETPPPQSPDSSSQSLCHSAVAPEVDALTTAAAAGDMLKVKLLLAGGVDVNAVNSFGRTAIQVMTLDNTDLAEVLLKAGANPNMQDEGRRAAYSTFRTIAHDVAASGYTDMLRCLLRHGADVNLQDRWGNTPLHLAAKGSHLAAVRLLRRGTSLHLRNQQGKNPIMLLEETGKSAAKQWVDLKKSTVSHLQTLCVLAVRRVLGPRGLRSWRKHAPSVHLQRQILLQSRGGHLLQQPSVSTLLSGKHSTGSKPVATRGRGAGGNGHPLVPGVSTNKHVTDFLTLRDLVPRRLSVGENTSLEVHNTSSGQSNDDVSLCALATSSLASENGSLFETNLSSIDASYSADELSLPSFDQSL